MMRKILFCSVIFLGLLASTPAFAAEQKDLTNFNVGFVKSGVTEIYFSEPSDPSVVRNTALQFELPEGGTTTHSSVGVHWSIFSIDDIQTEYNARIEVLFSQNSIIEGSINGEPSVERYMLVNTDPESSDGLNFHVHATPFGNSSVAIAEDECGVEENDATSGPVAMLSDGDRTLTLYNGTINPEEGVSGDVVLNMTLNAPIITAENPDGAFSTASYRGYLLLYVVAI